MLKKFRSDKGGAEITSAVFLVVMVVALLYTFIDFSIYFYNRSVMQSTVKETARTVAIMGGNGTDSMDTPIGSKYGATRTEMCTSEVKTKSQTKEALDAKGMSTPIECAGLKTFATNNTLIGVTVKEYTCTPDMTRKIGQRVSCTVLWNYDGLPGSGMNFARLIDENFLNKNTTVGDSSSEVAYDSNAQMVPRGA